MILRNVDTATICHSVTYQRTSETPPRECRSSHFIDFLHIRRSICLFLKNSPWYILEESKSKFLEDNVVRKVQHLSFDLLDDPWDWKDTDTWTGPSKAKEWMGEQQWNMSLVGTNRISMNMFVCILIAHPCPHTKTWCVGVWYAY